MKKTLTKEQEIKLLSSNQITISIVGFEGEIKFRKGSMLGQCIDFEEMKRIISLKTGS